MSIVIFTGAICRPNPGRGAWSFVAIENRKTIHASSGSEEHTTSNRMKILSALRAIQWLEPQEKAVIYSDLELLTLTYEEWMERWQKMNWEKDLKNLDLVKALYDLKKQKPLIRVKWAQVSDSHEAARFCLRKCQKALIGPLNHKQVAAANSVRVWRRHG